jgi:cell division protein FtsI (penicillin-binding protein 3)
MLELGTDILPKFRIAKATPNARQIFVLAMVFCTFAFISIYTLQLGLNEQGRTRKQSQSSATTIRADIVDRNGEILAKNVYSFDLYMNARQIKDEDKVAMMVHSIFPDISVNSVLAKIKTNKGDIEIKKNISRDIANQIRSEKIEGLVIKETNFREYPKHNSMAHIIGFADKDNNGVEGIEYFANKELINSQKPLELSIDSRIQNVMWTELSAAMTKYTAKAAMGIIINTRTGEVLAAVSLPDFDPENIGAYPTENRKFKILRDSFEMGSIFKILNTSLALSYGIPINTTFNVVDPFYVSGRRIFEAHGFKPPAKNLNIAQIMQYSCNSGSAQIALMLPENAQLNYFRTLRLDKVIETNFGKTGRTLFPQSNTPTDRSRWAFGHGIAITPLHLLLAANAIVNDGKYIMPTIYKRSFVPQTEQIVSREISETVRKILYKISDTSGKAAAMQIHGINIGGKTSTAQKLVDGKYSTNKNLTAFFSTWPIEAPKYSMLVILDEPNGYPRTSAFNAVPTSGNIIDAIIPLLE